MRCSQGESRYCRRNRMLVHDVTLNYNRLWIWRWIWQSSFVNGGWENESDCDIFSVDLSRIPACGRYAGIMGNASGAMGDVPNAGFRLI